MKAVYFDMDGTIADLYGVDGWEARLQDADATPYEVAAPLCDMSRLNDVCTKLQQLGYVIGVISWLAIGSSKDFDKATRKAKREWIAKHLPCVEEVHLVKYGTPKHYTCKVKDAVLVDDNKDVRDRWTRGETINPTCEDIVEKLESYLNQQAA